MRRLFASLLLLVLALSLTHAQEDFGLDHDGQCVEALGRDDDSAIKAIAELKTLGQADVVLKAAANESEPNILRRLRARAILRYREVTGEDWQKEVQFLVAVAAWDVPEGSPDAVARDKAAAREKLKADARPEVLPVLLSNYPEEDYPRYSLVRDLLAERGGDDVVAAVKPLITHASWIARLRAVHLLGLIGGDAAMDALSAGATDTNATVRQRVLQAWVEAGQPWSAKVATFLADKDAAVRVVALRGLPHDSEDAAVRAAARINDASFFVRRAAAEVTAAMGQTGLEMLLEFAKRATDDPGRTAAIRALGLVGDEQRDEALGTLMALLASNDWAVRAAAVEGLALAKHTAPLVAHRDLEEHPFVAYRLAAALNDADGKWTPLEPLAGPDPVDPVDPAPVPDLTGFDNLRWLPADEAALDDGLRALKLTRKDLEFDRNITTDDYRFPLVQRALNEPLALADITHDAIRPIREAVQRNRPDRLLSSLAKLPGIAFLNQPAPAQLPPGMAPAVADVMASDLPDELKAALVELLQGTEWWPSLSRAFARLDAADRALVLSHPDELGWDTKLLPVWKKIDRQHLMNAIVGWAAAVNRASNAAAGVASQFTQRQGLIFATDTPFGRVRINGHNDDRHVGHHLLLIDFGGNDSYDGPASGAAIGSESPEEIGHVLAATIDLAGNDHYASTTSYAQGCGVLGIGILIDHAGNDHYRGTAHCQGCGWFGGGLLIDHAGDDRYDGDQVCQAAAGFGVAALVDSAGDDVFYARAYAQGFGFTQGVAALCEQAGNDLYYVDGKYLQYETMPHRKLSMGQGQGYGMRSDASGGIGILWDKAGDDVYRVNAFGQGSSYWFSLGMLVDEDGYDNYSAKIYAQGSGIHMGVGVFADLAGNDNYLSWGLSMSGSHDLGVSYFLDAGGEDLYTCHGTAIGGAINHAVSLFVDRGGEDTYMMKAYTAMGAGDQKSRPDHDSIALFMDLGGAHDIYSDRRKADGRFWFDGDQGAGIDR